MIAKLRHLGGVILFPVEPRILTCRHSLDARIIGGRRLNDGNLNSDQSDRE